MRWSSEGRLGAEAGEKALCLGALCFIFQTELGSWCCSVITTERMRVDCNQGPLYVPSVAPPAGSLVQLIHFFKDLCSCPLLFTTAYGPFHVYRPYCCISILPLSTPTMPRPCPHPCRPPPLHPQIRNSFQGSFGCGAPLCMFHTPTAMSPTT